MSYAILTSLKNMDHARMQKASYVEELILKCLDELSVDADNGLHHTQPAIFRRKVDLISGLYRSLERIIVMGMGSAK